MDPVNLRIVPLDFYRQPTCEVARLLLGKILVRSTAEGIVAGEIVETEAYLRDDPASHAYRGPTVRNAAMFGPPGRTYVYLSYGMHDMLNIVTQPEGVGEAVLLRAAMPTAGIEIMRRLRGTPDVPAPLLASGPGRLAKAFGISRERDNGKDLTQVAEGIWIEEGPAVTGDRVIASTRIGITKGADKPWRYYIAGSPAVSHRQATT